MALACDGRNRAQGGRVRRLSDRRAGNRRLLAPDLGDDRRHAPLHAADLDPSARVRIPRGCAVEAPRTRARVSLLLDPARISPARDALVLLLLPPELSPLGPRQLRARGTVESGVPGGTSAVVESDDWKRSSRSAGSRSW